MTKTIPRKSKPVPSPIVTTITRLPYLESHRAIASQRYVLVILL